MVVAPAPTATAGPPADGKPPVIAPWDPEAPPPKGYELRSSVSGGAVGGGIALFTIGYLTSILVGAIAAQDEKERGIDGDGVEEEDWVPMYVPVVGPFVAVRSVDSSGGGTAFLVIDGLVQSLGAALVVWGIVDRNYRAVRTDVAGARVDVTPVVTRDRSGVSLQGAF